MEICETTDKFCDEDKKEGSLKLIPSLVNNKIEIQLNQSICKIYENKTNFSIGFLCKIPYPNESKLLPVLITNYHIRENFLNNKEIEISFDDDKVIKKIYINSERKYYYSKIYDVSIMEIYPNVDNIEHFLEFNQDYNNKKKETYENKNIYTLYYPDDSKKHVSYGIINNINSFEIIYKCGTEKLRSGSPIILLDNFKVIGVHKETKQMGEQINFGTLLRYPILEFNKQFEKKNEIIITIKIEEYDINKEVYILNYPYYRNSDGIKRKYEGLKEMNKLNTLMFINNEKVEYERNKKFKKKGIYEIKLVLNINLTDAYCMFLGCKNIIDINVVNFETKNINNMCDMFRDCKNIKKLNLSSFNTKNVTNMNAMFNGCNNLTNLDLSSFDTRNVNNMNAMFYDCNNLTNLDLSSFDTQKVTNMNSMFYYCNNLTNINLSSFETKDVTNMGYMFYGCNNLKNLNLSSFNTQNVIDMGCMFGECNNLTNLNLSSFNTKNLTIMNGMFYGCNNLTNINLTSFDTKNVIDLGYIFYSCRTLTNINLSSFNTKKVINMNGMFAECNNLTNIDLSLFDTKNVNNMNGMFYGCNNLTSIDLSSFNTQNVNDMSGMFYGCNNLTNIDLSSFDAKNVINMNEIFCGCNNLTKINLPSFAS